MTQDLDRAFSELKPRIGVGVAVAFFALTCWVFLSRESDGLLVLVIVGFTVLVIIAARLLWDTPPAVALLFAASGVLVLVSPPSLMFQLVKRTIPLYIFWGFTDLELEDRIMLFVRVPAYVAGALLLPIGSIVPAIFLRGFLRGMVLGPTRADVAWLKRKFRWLFAVAVVTTVLYLFVRNSYVANYVIGAVVVLLWPHLTTHEGYWRGNEIEFGMFLLAAVSSLASLTAIIVWFLYCINPARHRDTETSDGV